MNQPTFTEFGYSKIADFETCPSKYHKRWELGLAPKRVNEKMLAGTIFHAAREAWLRSGKDIEEGRAAIMGHLVDSTMENVEDFAMYCTRMFIEYATRWKDEKIERTGLEVDFSTDIAGFPFTGRLDGVVIVDGQVFVDEVKTTGIPPAQFIQEMHMDGKTTGYIWAARKITGKTIAGAYLDIIYKKRDKLQSFEFVRDITLRSDDQLAQWEDDTITKLARIKAARQMNNWPHHYGSCYSKYGRCPYLDLCKYGMRQELIDAQFTTAPSEEGGETE